LLTPFLILALLAGFSYCLNPAPWHHMSAGTEAVFAGTGVLLVILTTVMRKNMYLRMDERGLEVKYAVGAPRTYAWPEIESAKIVRFTFLRIPMTSSIHLRLRRDLRSQNVVRKMAGGVTGSDASFPAFFDESAEEIVEKIQFYKRESMSAGKVQYPA